MEIDLIYGILKLMRKSWPSDFNQEKWDTWDLLNTVLVFFFRGFPVLSPLSWSARFLRSREELVFKEEPESPVSSIPSSSSSISSSSDGSVPSPFTPDNRPWSCECSECVWAKCCWLGTAPGRDGVEDAKELRYDEDVSGDTEDVLVIQLISILNNQFFMFLSLRWKR